MKSVEEEQDDQMVWTGLHLAVRCESQRLVSEGSRSVPRGSL